METYNINSVIETIAPIIADRFNSRGIIEYTNGDTILLDFANSDGTSFENGNILVWSYQRPVYDETHDWYGLDEIDYGTESEYSKAFEFILSLLTKEDVKVQDFYKESF